MVVFVKTFDHYHLVFNFSNFFSCSVKLKENLKLKFKSKLNHSLTNHGYLHSAVRKALYNFKMKRAQEARQDQFFFQNVQINEIFESFEMLKNIKTKQTLVVLGLLVLISTGYTFFGGTFYLKTQNYQFKLQFCTQTNSNVQFHGDVHFFCFRLEMRFWANLVQKSKFSV